MLADGKSAEGKAIWVVRGGRVQIENIEFRGARVPSLNGAGIRFEKGHLVVRNSAFFDNEMGILTANHADMSLEVVDSEFGDAPHTQGDLHHLLYVGAIGRFSLRGSRFANGYLGHLVKSRARENHVLYNMLVDGAGGKASYELEFPNGGVAYVIGNTIGQSAGTDNPKMLSFGAEGGRWPENALYMAHNTLINDFHAGSFVHVWSDKLAGDVEVWLLNNLMVGNGELFRPAQGRFDGNRAVGRGELIEQGGVPSRLTSGSPLRGAVRPPGEANEVALLPSGRIHVSGRHPVVAGWQPAGTGRLSVAVYQASQAAPAKNRAIAQPARPPISIWRSPLRPSGIISVTGTRRPWRSLPFSAMRMESRAQPIPRARQSQAGQFTAVVPSPRPCGWRGSAPIRD